MPLHGFMVSWHPPLLGAPLAGFQQQQTFTEHLPGTVKYEALLGQDLHELVVLLCVNQNLVSLWADVAPWAQDLASDQHPFIEKKALFFPISVVDL